MPFTERCNLTGETGFCAIVAFSFSPMADGRQGEVNWNQFRGPNGQGVVQADRIAVHFGPEANVLWKTIIATGHSSPVIWSSRIFLTASEPAGKPDHQ